MSSGIMFEISCRARDSNDGAARAVHDEAASRVPRHLARYELSDRQDESLPTEAVYLLDILSTKFKNISKGLAKLQVFASHLLRQVVPA